MRVWIASFCVVFGLIELYQWAGEFTIPFPIYVAGGVLLAIASNWKKGLQEFVFPPSAVADRALEDREVSISPTIAPADVNQAPVVMPRSISFKIEPAELDKKSSASS